MFSAIKWQRMDISIFGLYLHSSLNMDIFMSWSGKDIKIFFFFTIKNLFFFSLSSEKKADIVMNSSVSSAFIIV